VLGRLKTQLLNELRKNVRPEFLNRIDEVVMFQPLLQSDIRHIVDIQLKRVGELVEKNNMHIQITDDAREWLSKSGFDPTYGARPLKRVIQRSVVDPLASKILSGDFMAGDTIVVDHTEAGQYTFTKI
jgi:ATP-dependent Clp protease ATP-binding subunit ClpB